MSVFGTHQRLCSWAKVASRTVQSGRKTGRARTGRGNPYLKAALAQMAMGAAKTDTLLGERYRRIRAPAGKERRSSRSPRPSFLVLYLLSAPRPASLLGRSSTPRTAPTQETQHVRHLEALATRHLGARP